MDGTAFMGYLKNIGLDDKAARRQLAIAEHLDVMMEARNKANGSGCGKRAARSLIDYLVEAKQDTVDNITAVLRYGHFVGNDDIYVEAFQILDGVEALDNLYLYFFNILSHSFLWFPDDIGRYENLSSGTFTLVSNHTRARRYKTGIL